MIKIACGAYYHNPGNPTTKIPKIVFVKSTNTNG
jgi:hypothetical protein